MTSEVISQFFLFSGGHPASGDVKKIAALVLAGPASPADDDW